MSVLTVILMLTVTKVQGNAKTINYSGIVRGGTQRLVKEELNGMQNDALIVQIDNILYSQMTGSGKFRIPQIVDKTYLKKLNAQVQRWGILKNEIYAFRKDPAQRDTLFRLSEEYYTYYDETVTAVQNYSESYERKFQALEWAIVAIIICNVLMIMLNNKTLQSILTNNDQLNRIAYTDAGTGLANQRKCEERLADKRPISETAKIICIMFDLNNLKLMNDRFGHEAGDQLIAGFGEALRQSMLPHMFVGRKGGDEFMAVSVNVERKEIDDFLVRLRSLCSERVTAGGRGISYACGTACSGDFPGMNIQSLMDVADKRMYENKKKMKGETATA